MTYGFSENGKQVNKNRILCPLVLFVDFIDFAAVLFATQVSVREWQCSGAHHHLVLAV